MQRLMPFCGLSAATLQQPEPLFEPFQDLRWRHHTRARRGELDRKRVGVEAGTKLSDRRRVLDGHGERRPGLAGSRREQRACLRFLDLEGRRVERQLERREQIGLLTLYRQRFATGRQDRELRRLATHRANKGGDRTQEVLAVVQHQQQFLVTKERGQAVRQRDALGRRVPDRCRDRFGDGVGITHPGQLTPPDAVREGGQQLRGDPQRQPRLAHATHADD